MKINDFLRRKLLRATDPWSDDLRLRHNVFLEVMHAGTVVECRETHNLVTKAGKEAVATLLKEGTTRPLYLAIGTGAEEAKSTDTKLQTEKSRKAATVTVKESAIKLEFEWAEGSLEAAITEEGILSASSEGTLFARSTFGTITLGPSTGMKVTHTITVE